MRHYFLVAAMLLSGACASDNTAPTPPGSVEDLFWSLDVNHPAVLMSTAAPYDTISLQVTPLNVRGQALPLEGVVTFVSAAPEKVQVTEDGKIKALATATGVEVTATLSMRNSKRVVKTRVTVTNVAAPPTLTTFSIQPLAPDSAKTAVSFPWTPSKAVKVRLLDQNENPIASTNIQWTSSNTTIADVQPMNGSVTGRSLGQVTIIARTTVYGVAKVDSLRFTVGMPVTGSIRIDGPPYAFFPKVDTIAMGGAVIWTNYTGDSVDVVFEDPSNVKADFIFCGCGEQEDGNIGPFAAYVPEEDPPEETYVSRSFPVPGVYNYRSTITGQTGQIVVVREAPVVAASRLIPKR